MSTAQLYTKVSGEGEVAGDVYVCLPCILGDGLFLVMEGTRNFPRTPPGWCPPPPTPYRLPGGYRSAVGAGTGLLAPWGERPLPVFHPPVESVLWREG